MANPILASPGPASVPQAHSGPTATALSSLAFEDSAFSISKFPVELIASVLSHLIDHKSTLASCTLAGRILLAPARMHLFHTIVIILSLQTPRGLLHSFAAFVASTPALACFVRDLAFHRHGPASSQNAPLVPLPLLRQVLGGLKGLRVLRIHDSFRSLRSSAGVSTNTGGETQEEEGDKETWKMDSVRALYATMPIWKSSSAYIYDILPWFPRLETLHLRGGAFSPNRLTDLNLRELMPSSSRLKDLSLILPHSSLHLLSLLQDSRTVHRLEALTVLLESLTDVQILDAFVRANGNGSSVRRLSVHTGKRGELHGQKPLSTEAFLPLKSTLAACPSMRSFCIWASTVPLLIHLLPILAHPHVEEVTFVLVGTLPRLEHTVRRIVNWKQLEATLVNGFPQLARFRFVQQHSEWAEKWMPLDELVRGWVRDELGADVAGMLYFE